MTDSEKLQSLTCTPAESPGLWLPRSVLASRLTQIMNTHPLKRDRRAHELVMAPGGEMASTLKGSEDWDRNSRKVLPGKRKGGRKCQFIGRTKKKGWRKGKLQRSVQ